MRVSAVSMGDDESPEDVRAQLARHAPPDNEAPVAVAVNAVVGRSDGAAVILSGFQVYSSGVEFTLAVRLREEPMGSMRRDIHELVGFNGPGADASSHLLLGVEFSDGRRAANIGIPSWHQGVPADQPMLAGGGGGGGGKTYDQTTWLTPVPPAGPMTFVCAWAAFDIEETHTPVDGTALAEARSRVVELWPWEPPRQEAYEPVEPQLPATGWFADTLGRR